MNPTIILVHGAFAESSSWDGVIDRLLDGGHPVIAAANPLRSLAADAEAVGDVVRTVDGPVVLVGHSYGGAVISNVPADAGEITGLVCDALQPVPRSNGATDLYISPERFHEQFCADVPASQAARMAVTQRPVTQEALTEPSGERPLWRELPRAGAHLTLEIPGGSHAIPVSHPDATAHQVLEAAALRAAAA
jgi:pimeloyl-ACP methyl ester carboxylesterase